MRYHVTGIDHAKGAHMTLDIDAPSKAAAEKRAQLAGMDVQHIQDVTNQDQHARSTHRGQEASGGSGWAMKLAVTVVIVAIVIAVLWPKIRAILQR